MDSSVPRTDRAASWWYNEGRGRCLASVKRVSLSCHCDSVLHPWHLCWCQVQQYHRVNRASNYKRNIKHLMVAVLHHDCLHFWTPRTLFCVWNSFVVSRRLQRDPLSFQLLPGCPRLLSRTQPSSLCKQCRFVYTLVVLPLFFSIVSSFVFFQCYGR